MPISAHSRPPLATPMSGYRSHVGQEQPLGGLSVRRSRGRTDSGNQDETPREEGAETPSTPYFLVAIEIHRSQIGMRH